MTQNHEVQPGECSVHGAYTQPLARCRYTGAPLPDPLVCPKCRAEHDLAVRTQALDQQRSTKDRERHASAAQLRNRLEDLAIIPERFAASTFKAYNAVSPEQRKVKGACEAFAQNWDDVVKHGSTLVLTGGVGTGKTHLGVAIAMHVAQGNPVAFAFGTVARIFRYVRSTYARNATRTEEQAIRDLVNVDLLVIDELGVQKGSENESNLLFEILNARYASNRPTVLLGNLTIEELEQFLGARLMSRLRQTGVVLALSWPDYRSAG